MSVWNHSDALEPIFLLGGLHGLKSGHAWLSFPFCLVYLLVLTGNVTILSVIWSESSLHQPMYYLLSILAVTDLGMSMSTLPTVLAVLWWEAQEIKTGACFAQLFFIHTFTFMESSVLLAMAFDHFIAICRPLHYSGILSQDVIGRICLGCLLWSAGLVIPTPILLGCYRYCCANVLSHPFSCIRIFWNYCALMPVSTTSIDCVWSLSHWAQTQSSLSSPMSWFCVLCWAWISWGAAEGTQHLFIPRVCGAHLLCASNRCMHGSLLWEAPASHCPHPHGWHLPASPTST